MTHNLQQAQRVADNTGFLYVDTTQGGRTGYLVEFGDSAANLRRARQTLTRRSTSAASSAKQITAVVFISALLAGCTPQTEPIAAAPRDGLLLRGGGATFPSLLYKRSFATYERDHPQTAISYDVVGSGEGVRRFIGGNIKDSERIDFGASDAAMSDEQIAQVTGGALLLPLTAGCVTLSYNIPGFEGDLRLSRRAYTAIFLGQVRNWNDPLIAEANPGVSLPKLTIVTVVRQDASGTTYAFTKHLDAVDDAWRNQYGAANLVNWPGNAMRAPGNEGVAGRIQHAEGSIGYVGYRFSHTGWDCGWLSSKTKRALL